MKSSSISLPQAARAVAKGRGIALGVTGRTFAGHVHPRQESARAFRERLKPVLDGCLAQGISRRAIVVYLNDMRLTAPRGGEWSLGRCRDCYQPVTASVCVRGGPDLKDPLGMTPLDLV